MKHLVNWAIDYARRGEGEKASSMMLAVLELVEAVSTPPSDPTREEYREAYETWRAEGQKMHAALLAIWHMAEKEDTAHLTYGDDPQTVVDAVRSALSTPPREDDVAVAIAKASDADYWTDEIAEWESSEEWERQAHPDNHPHTAYEDREFYRKLARAALAVPAVPVPPTEPALRGDLSEKVPTSLIFPPAPAEPEEKR